MTVISIDVGQVRQLRAVAASRVSDLHEARNRVQRTRDGLVVDASDPNAAGVTAHLDQLQGRLVQLADQLDQHRGDIDRFVQRITELDGRSLATTATASITSFRHFLSRSVQRTKGTARLSMHAVTSGLSRLGTPVLKTVRNVGYRAKDAYQRYVGDPLQRFKTFVKRGWRKVTDAFRTAWNAAWSKFTSIANTLAGLAKTAYRVTKKVVKQAVAVGKTAYRIVAHEIGTVLFTRFPTISHAPEAEWTSENKFTGTVKVNIPLEEFGFPGDLVVGGAGAIDIKYFDDGTAEVTFTQEFLIGLKADLAKAGVSADVIDTLGGEVTYLVKTGSISGQDAIQLFIEQEITRLVLQGLAVNAGTPVGLAAIGLLKAMAPPPEPYSVSAYNELKGEVKLDVPGVVKADVSAAIEERLTANRDGTSVVSLKATLEGVAATSLFGPSLGGSGKVEVTYSIEVDEHGIPTAVVIEGAGEGLQSAGREGDVVSATASAGSEVVATKRFEFGADDRNELAGLVKSGDIGGVLAKLDELATRVPIEVETIDVAKGEVSFDGGVLEASGEAENRVRHRSPASSGGMGW